MVLLLNERKLPVLEIANFF